MTNPILVRAAKGLPTERVPVWCMRQAGRSLPEYRKAKHDVPFMDAIRDVDLATELTMQPVRRYGVDGAVVYSDILTIPQAFGFNIEIVPEQGVVVHNPMSQSTAAREFDESKVAFVYDVVRSVRRQCLLEQYVDVAVIGFSGAPWTLLTYMMGDMTKDKSKTRQFVAQSPELAATWMRRLEGAVAIYLANQIRAGAHVVQCFDSWAGSLSDECFQSLVLPGYQRLYDELHSTFPDVPVIMFSKGAPTRLSAIARVGFEVVGVDDSVAPATARRLVGPGTTIQGNFDPYALFGSIPDITAKARGMVRGFGQDRLIANLGHGVPKDADPDHVNAFVAAVQTYNKPPLRIGTRSSPLAMRQATTIARRLQTQWPDDPRPIIVKIETKGDQNQVEWLHKLGKDDSSFSKELESALVDGRVDVAVHSLKDMESSVPPGLCLAAITKRHATADVFISDKYPTLESMPPDAVVGTASLRRTNQVLAANPLVDVRKIRGSVGKRLAKLTGGEYDAIVMALAGIERLQLEPLIKFSKLDSHHAVGQGALGIECRSLDTESVSKCAFLNDEATAARCQQERLLLASIHGGCGTPVGVESEYHPEDKTVTLRCLLFDPKQTEEMLYNRETPPKELYRGEERGVNPGESLGKKCFEVLRRE